MSIVVTAKFFPKPEMVQDMNNWFRENLSNTQSYEGCQLIKGGYNKDCLLYTSPSPRDLAVSRMPSSA